MDRRQFFAKAVGGIGAGAIVSVAPKTTEVLTIQVNAGRCFNHPYERYSNFRPSASITAAVPPGCDYLKEIKRIQGELEALMDDHKKELLQNLHKEYKARPATFEDEW